MELTVGDSELHTFRGVEPAGKGFIMGHEFTGEIVDVGEDVRLFAKGDEVVSAFTTSWYVRGLHCFSFHRFFSISANAQGK